MASRAENVQQIFAEMPAHFLPEKAGKTNAVIQLNLSGDDGGQWNVVVKDGTVAVNQGTHDHPTSTISMAAKDYLALVNGDANATMLFMQGKIKIAGDMNQAIQMQSWFN